MDAGDALDLASSIEGMLVHLLTGAVPVPSGSRDTGCESALDADLHGLDAPSVVCHKGTSSRGPRRPTR